MPSMSQSTFEAPIEINGDEITITQGDRRYGVREASGRTPS